MRHGAKNLGDAFKQYFRGQSAYPQFKLKVVDDRFRADNGSGTFDVQGKRIRLPKIGWIKMREKICASAAS